MPERKFQFGVVTDEISDDLRRAVEVAQELGIRHLELNQVRGRNVTELSPDQVREAKTIMQDNGMATYVVGTPCFKAVLLDEAIPHRVRGFPSLMEHLEILKRGIERAHDFNCQFVRVFSFRKSGMVGLGNPSARLPKGGDIPIDELHKIVEGLRIAGDLAQEGKVFLLVENVRSCWGNTGENVARIVNAVGHPRVKILWDPANSYVSGGMPYPEGYQAARERMIHVHIKDARVEDGATGLTSWQPVGAGEASCAEQMRALIEDGYGGIVSLETHWRGEGMTAEQSTREAFRRLEELVALACPQSEPRP